VTCDGPKTTFEVPRRSPSSEECLNDVIGAVSSIGQRELFAIEFLKRELARDRPGHNAVDCPGIDQKFDLDSPPARPTQIGDLRAQECNSEFFGGPFRARTGDPLIKSLLSDQTTSTHPDLSRVKSRKKR